ncbi:hypothetical protein [Actinocorallia populi]|uniref:hypothetical protein n=1 Tax=Actinocorallia populi TaxID=2079200 RepID=UPI000D093462|nr:hypothetical protein [Actinocorallia populi]
MNTAVKLSAFTLGMAGVFGVSLGAGQLLGPDRAERPEHVQSSPAAAHGDHGDHAAPEPEPAAAAELAISRADAPDGRFAFLVTGQDGKPVTSYDVEHDKKMHLIVVRKDLSGFRHVHPELRPDGAWEVESPLGEPGGYRAFADFKPTGGSAQVLTLDTEVPGSATERPLPAASETAEVDGYTVTLDGTLTAGGTSELTMSVSRDGKPVTDLQPYLGAYGHLVALRKDDLAYLHVHPEGAPGDGKTAPGPDITFFAEAPSGGDHRLYLDFQHEGRVHTAEFTVHVH